MAVKQPGDKTKFTKSTGKIGEMAGEVGRSHSIQREVWIHWKIGRHWTLYENCDKKTKTRLTPKWVLFMHPQKGNKN